jgi:hypothetical protein
MTDSTASKHTRSHSFCLNPKLPVCNPHGMFQPRKEKALLKASSSTKKHCRPQQQSEKVMRVPAVAPVLQDGSRVAAYNTQKLDLQQMTTTSVSSDSMMPMLHSPTVQSCSIPYAARQHCTAVLLAGSTHRQHIASALQYTRAMKPTQQWQYRVAPHRIEMHH